MHYVNYKQLKRAIKIAKPGTKGTAYFQSQVHEQLQAVNMFYASKEQVCRRNCGFFGALCLRPNVVGVCCTEIGRWL